MRHNKLSTKKANIISSTQKSSTLNPFLIHDFYDAIKEIITTKKLGSLQIWNAGETGFPIDPLDPLVIFQSKNLQSTWRDNKALPKKFYGVSEKSWMTTGIFAD